MERNYDFRSRLLEVHRPGRRDISLTPYQDELNLDGAPDIYVPSNAGKTLFRAARDMQEYLLVSMGVSARILPVEDLQGAIASGGGNIVFATRGLIGLEMPGGGAPRAFRVDCGENVVVTGFDEAGAMQGGFYLEDAMNLRRAPFVKKGTVERRPLFSPRMVHSGFALDTFPDAHIASIAHAGMDALLVFVKGPDLTPGGYCDFNDLCRRAAEYGVDVYAYSYLESGVHPGEPGAKEYYDRLYGSVFKACPGFKGVVLVGESVEFPSKDERTTGRSYKLKRPDGLPEDKPSPGWWPCRDYPQWLDLVKDSVRRYRPDADIVFWTYNWGYVEERYRIELIDRLPTDISLLVTFEMFEKLKTGPVTGTCVDYTLMFEGPGGYFVSEAKAAKRRGIRLYAMVNTGGLTWDIGVIPYEPAPQQWLRRHQAILRAREEYGLCGLMESHHYGFYPSFIGDLAKSSFTSGSPDPDNALRALAERDFGAEHADAVLWAWEKWSEGIRNCLPTNEDQYGPMRIGPSYPLALNSPVPLPESPTAMLGNRIVSTLYQNCDAGRCSLLSFRLPVEIEYLTRMKELFDEGADALEALLPKMRQCLLEDAQRMINLGRFIARCAETAVHVKQWYRLKLKLLSAQTNRDAEEAIQRMNDAADAEIKNAEAAIPLVQFDSRLGWEPTMEYMCDEERLRWKVKQVGCVKRELETYLKALAYNG